MEGLAGVVNASDVSPTGPDYQMFRTIMAGETNAAIEGAFLAGATDVLVRDGHGGKNNLRPSDVDPRARLLRGLSTGPKNMMEGIDSTFDAVVFVGYHQKRATEEIRRGVDVAIRNCASAKRFTMPAPYTMLLKVTTERPLFPGAQRTGDGAFTFTSNSLLEILTAFNAMK